MLIVITIILVITKSILIIIIIMMRKIIVLIILMVIVIVTIMILIIFHCGFCASQSCERRQEREGDLCGSTFHPLYTTWLWTPRVWPEWHHAWDERIWVAHWWDLTYIGFAYTFVYRFYLFVCFVNLFIYLNIYVYVSVHVYMLVIENWGNTCYCHNWFFYRTISLAYWLSPSDFVQNCN